MNCQSRLVRLFLSSCCGDEFKTADKVECIGFLLRAVKGLYSAEPSNSCSILSDNSWDPIRSEKWNELWLESGSRLLSQTKIIKRPPRLLYYFRSLHYWLARELNCSEQGCLSRLTPGSRLRGSLMGSQHGKGLSYYHLRGILKDSESQPLAILRGFFFIVHGLSIITCCRINIIHLFQ